MFPPPADITASPDGNFGAGDGDSGGGVGGGGSMEEAGAGVGEFKPSWAWWHPEKLPRHPDSPLAYASDDVVARVASPCVDFGSLFSAPSDPGTVGTPARCIA